MKELQNNIYIKHPVSMEQYLMEGSYNKVSGPQVCGGWVFVDGGMCMLWFWLCVCVCVCRSANASVKELQTGVHRLTKLGNHETLFKMCLCVCVCVCRSANASAKEQQIGVHRLTELGNHETLLKMCLCVCVCV